MHQPVERHVGSGEFICQRVVKRRVAGGEIQWNDARRWAPQIDYLVIDSRQGRFVATQEQYLGTVLGAAERDGLTDAAVGPGNQYCFTRQLALPLLMK